MTDAMSILYYVVLYYIIHKSLLSSLITSILVGQCKITKCNSLNLCMLKTLYWLGINGIR